jgi:hypothetical protein
MTTSVCHVIKCIHRHDSHPTGVMEWRVFLPLLKDTSNSIDIWSLLELGGAARFFRLSSEARRDVYVSCTESVGLKVRGQEELFEIKVRGLTYSCGAERWMKVSWAGTSPFTNWWWSGRQGVVTPYRQGVVTPIPTIQTRGGWLLLATSWKQPFIERILVSPRRGTVTLPPPPPPPKKKKNPVLIDSEGQLWWDTSFRRNYATLPCILV